MVSRIRTRASPQAAGRSFRPRLRTRGRHRSRRTLPTAARRHARGSHKSRPRRPTTRLTQDEADSESALQISPLMKAPGRKVNHVAWFSRACPYPHLKRSDPSPPAALCGRERSLVTRRGPPAGSAPCQLVWQERKSGIEHAPTYSPAAQGGWGLRRLLLCSRSRSQDSLTCLASRQGSKTWGIVSSGEPCS